MPRHHIGDQFKQVDAFTANAYFGNATALSDTGWAVVEEVAAEVVQAAAQSPTE